MTHATFFRLGMAVTALTALTACGNTPPVPDWQLNAKGALERATEAYFTGNARVEVLEFERACSAIASTGQVDQLARAELLRFMPALNVTRAEIDAMLELLDAALVETLAA